MTQIIVFGMHLSLLEHKLLFLVESFQNWDVPQDLYNITGKFCDKNLCNLRKSWQ